MSQDQRKLANYIKTSGLSKGYYLQLFAGGVACLGILMIYCSNLLSDAHSAAAAIPDVQTAGLLQDRIFTVAVLFFLSFAGFLGCTIFYLIVLGQRVGGPVIAICSYIQELKKGNYDVKRTLRKNDELGAIMSELQDLAESLKTKSERP
ncbi:MAG: hypothetical protein KF799_08695 [Bdellovibrionales bacterium]|nr:hypothetical protein [Bdellovibrionales bacterium]